mgnify:CR=1 FL=1
MIETSSNKKQYIPLVILLLTLSVFYFCKYSQITNFIQGDGRSYYQYLIDIFITHDFSAVNKYPIGTALLQMPFFLIAHLITLITSPEMCDGYSFFYNAAVYISAVFYNFLGCFFIYNIIVKRYNWISAMFTVFSVSFGTMLLYYSTYDCSYSHVYSFAICSASLNYVIYYDKNILNKNTSTHKKIFTSFILGFLAGLIILIRNTNAIFLLVYFLYDVTNFKILKLRLRKIFNFKILIYQILGILIAFLPQAVYWKIQSGHFIINSYGNEEFYYWNNPKITYVLFSDAKGLFIFCPILLISMICLLIFRKELKEFRTMIWTVFILNTYIISSWWAWWMGFGYSCRLFCDILCLFALPLGALFGKIFSPQKLNITGILIAICKTGILAIAIAAVIINLIWIDGIKNNAISMNFSSWQELTDWLNYIFK